MTRFTSSRPHESIMPRPHRDAHQRYLTYGPIQPMDYPRVSIWQRLKAFAERKDGHGRNCTLAQKDQPQ